MASFAVKPRAPLVPVHQYDGLPSYYVYAGLVFSPLTQPHLQEFGDDWFNTAPRRLVDRALNDSLPGPGGCHPLAGVGGRGQRGVSGDARPRGQGSEREGGEESEGAQGGGREGDGGGGKFLRLDFVNDRVLVISTEEAERAHGRIMAKHRVPSRMSLIW